MAQNEIFKIQGSILLKDEEFIKGLKNALGEAEKGSSKMSNFFSKMGKGAIAVGKTVATGLAAAGAGVTALVTKSIQSYADYEQLAGGVETLFKNSSDKVKEYAKNAYQTAGLSANEYMETVTSFSASLLQSLDGDTAKAAEKADMAITDMSDNANKMGTSMEMIQNAYQGFAKSNYTMLDNLKLGKTWKYNHCSV
jgi:phage-related protein